MPLPSQTQPRLTNGREEAESRGRLKPTGAEGRIVELEPRPMRDLGQRGGPEGHSGCPGRRAVRGRLGEMLGDPQPADTRGRNYSTANCRAVHGVRVVPPWEDPPSPTL